jgi:hypothetical protein
VVAEIRTTPGEGARAVEPGPRRWWPLAMVPLIAFAAYAVWRSLSR